MTEENDVITLTVYSRSKHQINIIRKLIKANKENNIKRLSRQNVFSTMI